MKYIGYLALALIVSASSCKQEEVQPTGNQEKVWTKTMIHSVDIDKTYFEDIEDEDFSEFSTMFGEVVQAVYDGKLQAYEYWTGDPISADSARSMFIHVDTFYVENETNHMTDKKVVKIDYSENIPSIKIKEKWHLDKNNWKIEKKVLAIAPRIPVYSQGTGDLKGYSPLFWIFVDKEAEEAFIQERKERLDS